MVPRRLSRLDFDTLRAYGADDRWAALRGPRALSAIATAIVFVADCVTPADYVVGVFYFVAMVLAALTRSRPWLAGVGVAAAALTMLAAHVGAPVLPGTSVWTMLANRVLTVAALVGLALALDWTLRLQNREDLLRREIDHRAKNVLAAVTALLRLVPREDPKRFAQMVEARIHAMARIHSLLAEGRWQGADLYALARRELAPFAGPPDRMRLDGPAVQLNATVAQPLGMVLHELATNSVKHGAFSVPAGQLSLRWSVDPRTADLLLEWTEVGGPPVAWPPERRGFGTRLMGQLAKQIGGSLERAWATTGLRCVIKVPRQSYARPR